MKKTIILTAALLVTLTGCKDHKDNPVVPENGKPVPIRLSFAPVTKVTDTAYENGDAVGLYVVNEGKSLSATGNHATNVPFSFTGSLWNSSETLYWKDQNTRASFYCYYPYRESIAATGAVPVSVRTDQSSLEGYKASEVLWGKREGVAPTADLVEIRTSHRMSSLLVYIFPGKGYTAETLADEGIAVTINSLRTAGTLNLESGEITATGSPADITPYPTEDGFRALVIPQTLEDETLISLRVGENSYSLKQSITLKSGTQHHVTLTVNKVTEGINIGIDGWETDDEDYGGTIN